jgi:hypothetical protein
VYIHDYLIFKKIKFPVHFCGPLSLLQCKVAVTVGCRWLTPILLATQEAEIRKINVGSQPRQIVHENLSGKTLSGKSLVEWLKM